ncbi:type 4a pilus biogenesis protein PilO [Thermosulfurimonas marina]|uniref:Type 4a pilus biogenesis protein PilO n=1 Tax=Thermosulfurimonas marina TaxID=2047767 RepID=A0A6H1WQY3_9BACT|nr:type 4a pilus biogenesis protein PilO [Thermosulfurimonas marina]QJA05569.1 type 4a pilus biogenesis protein PilO [Thermosulfurimonas marina]
MQKFKKIFQKIEYRIREKIEPLPKNQKIVLAILSLVVPILLYFYFFVRPTYYKINSLKTEIVKLEKEVEKYRKMAQERPLLEKKLAARELFLKRLVATLPTEKEIPGLLQSVSAEAQNSKLNVISFSPHPQETPQNYYNKIDFTVEVEGEFPALVSFLDKVLHLSRIIHIEALDINLRQKKGEKEGTFQPVLYARCDFATYRYTGKSLNTESEKRRRRRR